MGYYVQLEGPDGVGKTTAFLLAAEALRKRIPDLVTVREPGDGAVGQRIRRILRGDEPALPPTELAALYAEDRLRQAAVLVLPPLASGQMVLSDRGILSSLAYQHASAGIPLEVVLRLNRFAPKPDLIVLLYASEETCRARRAERGGSAELFDDSDAQRAVRNFYNRNAPSMAVMLHARLVRVNAEASKEAVACDIVNAILEHQAPLSDPTHWPHA